MVQFIYYILVLLIMSPLARGDGGVLRYQPALSEGDRVDWPSVDYYLSGSHKQSTLTLSDNQSVDVYIYSLRTDGKETYIYLTDSKPYRLIVDANGDGQIQDDEITLPEEDESGVWFKHVNIPDRIGNVLRPCLVNFHFDEFFSGGRTHRQLRFTRESKSLYQGEIEIGDNLYQARLIPAYHSYRDKTVVVLLDSNGDGEFDHFRDFWFCCNRPALIDGNLKNVETSFLDDKAEISITPYEEATGQATFKIEGEEIHRLHVFLARPPTGNGSEPPPDSRMCIIPLGENPICTLPAGHYQIDQFWLKPENPSGPFLQNICDLWFNVIPNSSYDFCRNGPLEPLLNINYKPFAINQFLWFKGLSTKEGTDSLPQWERNSAIFLPIRESDIIKSERPPAPAWELWDSDNRIASGQFEYG